MKRNENKAFTLIELLVVIAIISLLVSILVPSLNKAKELAKTTVCSSNERSIGLALIFYSSDESDCFPYVRNADYTDFWFNHLRTMLPDGAVTHDNNRYNAAYMCPSEENHHESLIDYAINTPYIAAQPYVGTKAVSPQSILRPSDTVMVCDGREYWAGKFIGTWAVYTEFGHSFSFFSQPYGLPGPYPTRHGDKMNFVYTDGHVDTLKVDPEDAASFDDLEEQFTGQSRN